MQTGKQQDSYPDETVTRRLHVERNGRTLHPDVGGVTFERNHDYPIAPAYWFLVTESNTTFFP